MKDLNSNLFRLSFQKAARGKSQFFLIIKFEIILIFAHFKHII